MPFKLGAAPIRKSLKYLEAGKLVFKDRVKIMSIYYCEDEFKHLEAKTIDNQRPFLKNRDWFVKSGPHHNGAINFVFWNLPQVQFMNPDVQIVTFKNKTPSPFIECFLDDGSKVLFDVDSQDNVQILDRLVKTLGKSKDTLEAEALASEKKDNPANFGKNCDRWCICSTPGQLPCPAVVPVPKHWRGKYDKGKVDLDE